ncbi:MAG TPA: ATP-binding protein [Mycobacteriales bacterium]|nr:ATP-binding protein [Mycobacteriales bacterium]
MQPAQTALDMIHIAEVLAFGGVLLAILRRRPPRPAGTAWLVGIFGIFTAITLLGVWAPRPTHSLGYLLYAKVVLAVLFIVPYLFVRLAEALAGIGGRRLATACTLAVLVGTAALPRLPLRGERRPVWFWIWLAVALLAWVVQSFISGTGLWRAGRGQPTVVRRRLRLLASGTLALAVTLVVSGFGPASNPTSFQVVVAGMALVSILLFVLAFALPGFLRVLWRQPEARQLAEAEAELMSALTPERVAGLLLPHITRLVGGSGAALLGLDGRCIDSYRMSPDDLARAAGELPGSGDGGTCQLPGDLVACRLQSAWLVAQVSAATPLFGADEMHLLETLGQRADLALARGHAYAEEQRARDRAEAANEELQSVLYSVSHDLRSPLISLAGYLGYLREDYGELLPDGAGHYLSRMDANVAYMTDLIQDLLDLSRVGRADTSAIEVEVRRLAAEVADEVESQHPGVRVAVEEPLPVLWMNDLRSRQLFTNLIENAVRHSGRPDVTVTVRATAQLDGAALVTVTDDGVGVPEAYREQVFRMFERLEPAGGGSPGTGIGLAVCRRIMESAGGRIELAARPGGGACVQMWFPAALVRRWPAFATSGSDGSA